MVSPHEHPYPIDPVSANITYISGTDTDLALCLFAMNRKMLLGQQTIQPDSYFPEARTTHDQQNVFHNARHQ